MKRSFFTWSFRASITAACLLLSSSMLSALGLGGYLTAGKAGGDETTTSDYSGKDYDHSVDTTRFGLGFVFDTNLANDNLFNYRLHTGFTKVTMDRKISPGTASDVKGYEYHLYNSFGFGVFRNESARFWLGPQIGFGVMRGKFDDNSSPNEYTAYFGSFGAILGINFNAGNSFTLGIDGGYRFSWYGGRAIHGKNSDKSDNGLDVAGNGKEAFADVCFIFRINDRFQN